MVVPLAEAIREIGFVEEKCTGSGSLGVICVYSGRHTVKVSAELYSSISMTFLNKEVCGTWRVSDKRMELKTKIKKLIKLRYSLFEEAIL